MFVFLYVAVFFVGGGIIAAHGYSLEDSLFEFASALSTVGISVGITAADAPHGVLWIQTAAMLLGRLEFFTVVIGLVRIFNDVPTMLKSSGTRQAGAASVSSATGRVQKVGEVLNDDGQQGEPTLEVSE
jgi:Trk-type K+ transport system membrane component